MLPIFILIVVISTVCKCSAAKAECKVISEKGTLTFKITNDAPDFVKIVLDVGSFNIGHCSNFGPSKPYIITQISFDFLYPFNMEVYELIKKSTKREIDAQNAGKSERGGGGGRGGAVRFSNTDGNYGHPAFSRRRQKQSKNSKQPRTENECETTYENQSWFNGQNKLVLMISNDWSTVEKLNIKLNGKYIPITYLTHSGKTTLIMKKYNTNFNFSAARNEYLDSFTTTKKGYSYIGIYTTRGEIGPTESEIKEYLADSPKRPQPDIDTADEDTDMHDEDDEDEYSDKKKEPDTESDEELYIYKEYIENVPPKPKTVDSKPKTPAPHINTPQQAGKSAAVPSGSPQIQDVRKFRRSPYISILRGEDADNWKSILRNDFSGSDCKAVKDDAQDWRLVLDVPKNVQLFKIRMQGSVNLNYNELKDEFTFTKNNVRQRKLKNAERRAAEEAKQAEQAAKELASKQPEMPKDEDKGKGKAKEGTDSSDGSTSSDSSDSSDSSEASMTSSQKELQEAIKMSLQVEEESVKAPETIAEPKKQLIANEAEVTSPKETGVSATAPQENPIEATGDNNVNTNGLHAVLTKVWKSIAAIVVAAVTVMFGSFMGRGGQ